MGVCKEAEALEDNSFCSVCGRRLKTARGNGRSFDSLKFQIELAETFSLDISSDDPSTHTLQLCFFCDRVIRPESFGFEEEGSFLFPSPSQPVLVVRP